MLPIPLTTADSAKRGDTRLLSEPSSKRPEPSIDTVLSDTVIGHDGDDYIITLFFPRMGRRPVVGFLI